MKKLALSLMLIASLTMLASPALAFPSCTRTNDTTGVTSRSFGNCIVNVAMVILTFGLKIQKTVCNASPEVIAVCNAIKPIAATVGAEVVLNIITSILTVGCSDEASISRLIEFINTYNAGMLTQTRATYKGAPMAATIDPWPLIVWKQK